MSALYIVVVDDESPVLDAVVRDLSVFEDVFPVVTAENAVQARETIREILAAGDAVALLLCDHVMPGQSGVDLLIDLHHAEGTALSRKVLLTGQAGLDATVDAVNRAGLVHYIRKPWKAEELQDVVRLQLTEYVIASGTDPTPYLKLLDPVLLATAVHKGKLRYGE